MILQCFLQCLWVKEGLVKDGAFDTETFVKANVKTEFQEKVLSSFQTCLKEKGIQLWISRMAEQGPFY